MLIVLRYIFIFISIELAFSQQIHDTSRYISIQKIIYEGNIKTKENIISREMSFKKDDTFLLSQIDSLFKWNRIRIYNTNLFNEVELSLENIRDNKADVRIKLEERWYTYPIPIFKLIDRNFNDWWENRNRDFKRVNYGLEVNKYNFRGRNEFLKLVFQSGFSKGISLIYNLPYIDKKQLHGILFDLNYLDFSNVAYTTINNIPEYTLNYNSSLRKEYKFRLRHSYRSSFYTFHRSWIGFQKTEIADTLVKLNPNYLLNASNTQHYFFLGYSFLFDKRNNVNYATKGERLNIAIFKNGLGLFSDGIDNWKFRLNYSKYWDLTHNFYFASNISILYTFPDEMDYFNYERVGTSQQVMRGYDTKVIEGSNIFIQRNEFRYSLFERKYNIRKIMPVRQFQTFPLKVFGKLYYDQGYVKGYPNFRGSDILTNSYLYSIGTGLDMIIVNDIVIRLEYSVTSSNQKFVYINFLALL